MRTLVLGHDLASTGILWLVSGSVQGIVDLDPLPDVQVSRRLSGHV